MAVIFYWNFREIEDLEGYKNDFFDLLPKTIGERAGILSEKRGQSVMAWILLFYGFHRLKKRIDRKTEVVVNRFGKPALRDCELKFNLSHSGDFVSCVVSERCEVGIDVQKRREVPLHILKEFFGEQDYKRIQNSDQVMEWCRLWTRKEALLKCAGSGWQHPEARRVEVSGNTVTFDQMIYFVGSRRIRDDYDLSICTQKAEEKITWIEVENGEMEQFRRQKNRSAVL
ncbi:MAG: 4'-phosphopantetheinyl transferase superfamily protein [Lachnospiraceae bacterium]|nr:4'-phosphopantetheinyl transferase superfamily protein [Robinsoniella sp.]MDY3767833.1 4'-phosphopantetheinyl transferase superfamily protein [Lachnospiraceae bacterium]